MSKTLKQKTNASASASVSANVNASAVDEEWEKFITKSSLQCIDSDSEDSNSDSDFDNENSNNIQLDFESSDILIDETLVALPSKPPPCGDMYISTKSKIIFLNQPVDLKSVFWGIPIQPYGEPRNGVIKKQMKFNSVTEEEFLETQAEAQKFEYVDQHIIRSINNPDGRIKFKDTRKISIGLCKKDLLSYRCKKKSAFYNCFVLIIRMYCKESEEFKEHHVKIFNTGKVGIVGVQDAKSFNDLLEVIISILKPHFRSELFFKNETASTILINSNFSTGFLINRESFYDILKFKYKIDTIYDPCSYPGIQCKYKYRDNGSSKEESPLSQLIRNCTKISNKEKSQTKVSFMIFRTGSILIVGKCDEVVLSIVYDFLKTVIEKDFHSIYQGLYDSDQGKANKKLKQKTNLITLSTVTSLLNENTQESL